MLFLDTKFAIDKIIRKEGVIEFHSEDGKIPFYFKVKPNIVIFCREDSDPEVPFTNDIFIKACYNNGKYTFTIQFSNGDDTLSLDGIADAKYYMIPLTKEDSAVRSIKNKNKIKEYESIISKNQLIMYPEDINMAIDQANKANDNDIHLQFWKDGFFGTSPMKISLRKSVLPSYNRVKCSTKYGMIAYTKHNCNRLPVENITYNVAVYDSINNTLIDNNANNDFPEETAIDMDAEKPVDNTTRALDIISNAIGRDSQSCKANIIMPQHSNMRYNWTKSVMLHVDKPSQLKIHELNNWSSIIFDFESPVEVLCKTIITDIRKAESYALNVSDINRIGLCYNYANKTYAFILCTTMGQEINYNQLPFLPTTRDEQIDQIYITIANRCVIINDSPYLDSDNKVLSYVNAIEYISQ